MSAELEAAIKEGSLNLDTVSMTEKGNDVNTSVPSQVPMFAKINRYISKEITFFRVHAIAFTFLPLIFASIFFASNGRFPVGFVDSMFLCYSAMTVTGLSTINLSTLTVWQQFILYFLMMIGDITIVSWIMVLIRKRFFRTHCEYLVASRSKSRLLRSRSSFLKSISPPVHAFKPQEPTPRQEKPKSEPDTYPQFQYMGPTPGVTVDSVLQYQSTDKFSDDGPLLSLDRPLRSSPASVPTELPSLLVASPTIRTIEFAASTTFEPRPSGYPPPTTALRSGRATPRRTLSMSSNRNALDGPSSPGGDSLKYQGFGGFPGPARIARRAIKIVAPRAYRKMERKLTLPSTTTLEESSTPWLSFDGLTVGRNSDFRTETLTDDQLEDLGGVEYRALRLLSYLVPMYFVGCHLAAVLFFLPWLSVVRTYDGVFDAQFRLVSKPWFAFFQVMGAYTGGGLSLVDLGMVPFQNAYLMIIALMFSILAGNHALPIFLRFIIWVFSKIVPGNSDLNQALSFLLDHPRRCFLYLFPSHQTWFLVICLVLFSAIEWVGFLILDIGLPAYESIPTAPRVVAGLFQGLAVRASGFAIFPIASFSPALQFLYVVMMYIAVYPVAMSIRSTNVYEERSLGVFESPPDDEDEEPSDIHKLKSRRERIGRYVGWHLRRQMSIDIWWLVWGVFVVAIIERGNLLDESKKWFDLFRVLFELVSAFGGIGLSLGFPGDNFSFAGAMSPLSKLVIIIIMVRGRHRGLPVAVDRAVLLPSELVVNRDPENKQAENVPAPINLLPPVS